MAHHTPVARHAAQRGVELSAVVSHLSRVLPDDAVIANGACNYTAWVHRFFQYKRLATELAPTNGAMGYGLPAAIAAACRPCSRSLRVPSVAQATGLGAALDSARPAQTVHASMALCVWRRVSSTR